MPEISLFVDESGESGTESKYYLLTLVFHEQNSSIDKQIELYENALHDKGLPDIPLHTPPLLNGHDDYEGMDIQDRKRLLQAFFTMLQRPKLDRGVVRPIERTRINGHEAASPVGEQPYERLGYVSTHGLPNENRPFESLAREDLLEHQRKVVQAPIERERPRLPMGRGIPHQAPCPLGKVINLLIKQTMVSGKAGQEDKLRRFLIVFRHPVAQCPTIGFELALSHAYPPIAHQSKSARTLKDPRALCIVCDVRCITARCGRTSQAVRRRRRRRGNCNTWRLLPCARAVLRAFWPRPLRPSFPSPGPGRTR